MTALIRPSLVLAASVLAASLTAACSTSSSADTQPHASDPASMSMAGTATSSTSDATRSSSSKAATQGSPDSQHITVHTEDTFRFGPATIAAHVGTVRVTLVDDGSYPHNLEVPSLHVTSPTVSGSPGEQTATFTLHFTHAGTVPFDCVYHDSAGMRGEFVVTP